MSANERQSGLTVRSADKADIPHLCRLMQHVQDVHAEAHPEIFRATLDPEATAAYFADLLSNDHNVVFVAEKAGETAGYIWCQERIAQGSFYALPAHTGYIHHVSVTPGHRRHGIGNALIAAVLAELKGRGATRIAVDFWAFNDRARSFFAGAGFAVQRELCSRDLPAE